ncbi:MAG: chemotaxis protein CheX [Thermodesulfobacteriota bacterium]|nr:chemotaxis protein CheX [Thermodesulfobacteriota bacterium]
MNDINGLDLQDIISNSINEVFETMLSMKVEVSNDDSPIVEGKSRIVGSVSFAGTAMGNINIHVGDSFARLMTAAILGMELEEIEGEEEVKDVVGELSNMIGGALKSRLCDSGFPCELSIPSVVSGEKFNVESMGWARQARFAFRHEQHTAFAEVFMNASK